MPEVAFDPLADVYDTSFSNSLVGHEQRMVSRKHLGSFLAGKKNIYSSKRIHVNVLKEIPDNTSMEAQAEAAFTRQSVLFDDLYAGNTIVQYKRKRVREHLQQYLAPNSKILELNAGTGEDAIYLAKQGHAVHATDISKGMLGILQQKVLLQNQQLTISTERCSFTQLEDLLHKGPYDHIFSNFAGLNCTGSLDKVLTSFSPLLKPGGMVTLVLLPKFCLWEFLLLFRGRFKTAFRRFTGSKGAKAHIEGVYFKCWYYNPSYTKKQLKNSFECLRVEGLCTIVPPSYIENFAEKHPRLYKTLTTWEDRLKCTWPWKYTGDYYIITLKKKD